jgi:hypothetical protein
MKTFLRVVIMLAVAIAATLVPLHRATWDAIIFGTLAIIGVLLVRLRMAHIIPRWATALTLILAGAGHLIAYWWTARVFPGSPNLSHLRAFGIAYLVIGFYLWATGRLRYQRE